MNCINCGKPSEARLCPTCVSTMPEHIKPFATEEIFKLIDDVAEELVMACRKPHLNKNDPVKSK